MVEVADHTGNPVKEVAATYFAVAALLGTRRLTRVDIATADYFDRLALDRARDAIGDAERKVTAAIITAHGRGSDAVAAWAAKHQGDVERVKFALAEMAASGLTVSKLAVAASMLNDLTRR
jgi:glutamate dehydrogenase